MERVRQAGDEPFALETCYLSADEFPALAGGELERGSLFITLEHEYGVELAYADEEIDATAADLKTAELLAVPRGSPLLRIRQLIFTTKGRACMYVLGLYRSGPPHAGDSQIPLIGCAAPPRLGGNNADSQGEADLWSKLFFLSAMRDVRTSHGRGLVRATFARRRGPPAP